MVASSLFGPQPQVQPPLSPDQPAQDFQPSSECLAPPEPAPESSAASGPETCALTTEAAAEATAEDPVESLRCWAETDPQGAASAVSRLPDGPRRRAACEQVAIAWAGQDFPAALTWSQGLPGPEERRMAVLALVYEAARTDPSSALAAAEGLPPSPERDEALSHALRQWTATDAAAAVNWVGQLQDTALRQRLLGAMAVANADQRPFQSATLAATAMEPGADQARAVVAIVQRWVQTSPADAAAWVAQFPDGSTRDDAQRELRQLIGPNQP